MNKGRRHELKMLKYKRRLKLYGLKEAPNANLHAFRSHGAPCSCWACKGEKYKRGNSHRDIEEGIQEHAQRFYEDDFQEYLVLDAMYGIGD